MKKIMTALTLGALIGTVAFADVDINLGFRQRANMYYNHEGTGKLFNTDIYADTVRITLPLVFLVTLLPLI